MRGCGSRGTAVVVVGVLLATFGASWARAQPPKTLKQFGEPVYPAYEGWYENADGSFTLLVGYFNPNKEQTLNVEIGEGNYMSPGPLDQGQPTHFPSGRGHGPLHDSGAGGLRRPATDVDAHHKQSDGVRAVSPQGGVLRRAVPGCLQPESATPRSGSGG